AGPDLKVQMRTGAPALGAAQSDDIAGSYLLTGRNVVRLHMPIGGTHVVGGVVDRDSVIAESLSGTGVNDRAIAGGDDGGAQRRPVVSAWVAALPVRAGRTVAPYLGDRSVDWTHPYGHLAASKSDSHGAQVSPMGGSCQQFADHEYSGWREQSARKAGGPRVP